MISNVFKYLQKINLTDPESVDRLFVSAYIQENNIVLNNNTFVQSYIITNAHIEEMKNLNSFIETLHHNKVSFTIETLINLFEFVISPADRVVNGAIYTPCFIREYITDYLFSNNNRPIQDIKIADIACGCGGFLYNATILLNDMGLSFEHIYGNNIYGLDIQEYSINRTKLLLTLLAISKGEDIAEFRFNLHIGDALEFKWDEHIAGYIGFDMILGNPPYVRLRNLNDQTRVSLKKWEVCSTGLTDLYIPFFQIGLENLRDGGALGYITMNSFFKSLNGRALRNYFTEHKSNISIIDFGANQIFKSRNTYTCICIIENSEKEYINYQSISPEILNRKRRYTQVRYDGLNSFTGWNLKENTIISKIENTGSKLGDKITSRHGIATLKNNVYIFKTSRIDDKYFYNLSDGIEWKIEKEICKDIINPNKLNGKKNISDILEKIIFPYVLIDGKTVVMAEDALKNHFPFAFKYLLSKKKVLAKRDNGNGKYPAWYAYGRTQSLGKSGYKLFLPKISNKPPVCTITTDEDLYYYNGQAIISNDLNWLIIIKKIIESKLFWYYILNTSKPYSSNYYSLNGGYIKYFGVYDFSENDINYLLNEDDNDKLDSFLYEKYQIQVS